MSSVRVTKVKEIPQVSPSENQENYTARHLQVLEGLEAVRKRPGMYIGSTDGRGLMHCLWEIIDNAVDEALGGYCDRIEVILLPDGSVEVRDNGRGIPVDVEPRTGLSGVEVVFTKLHAGGKFGGGSYTASGGLHGVGASVVNALSSRLDVEVDRASKTYGMSFRRGEPGTFADGDSSDPLAKSPTNPFTPFESGSQLEVVGKARRGVTGSRVRYWADTTIFLKTAQFDYDQLIARARQTSFLVPGLTIIIRDERGLAGTPGENGPHEETFLHDGGISEFTEFLAADPAALAAQFDGRPLNPRSPGAEAVRRGLHVVVPIRTDARSRVTWDQNKAFAKAVAEAIRVEAPDRFTTTLAKKARGGKIFIDYLRNGRGSTAIMPYSARARAGAPVAAPVTWSELRDLDTAANWHVGDAAELTARANAPALSGWGVADQMLPDL